MDLNPTAIMEMLDYRLNELGRKNKELDKLGDIKAEAEMNYRVELRKEILSLTMNKVKISLIHDLARGKEEIAKLRYKRDIAANAYYTCKSAVENKRLEIEVLRSKLTWLREELKGY